MALLRNTPPETRMTESEVRFIDILYQELPHDRTQQKIVKRAKSKIIELVGSPEVKIHENESRITGRIEALFAPKAIHMGLLKRFDTYINKENLEIYEWEYSDEETLNQLLNNGEIPKRTDHTVDKK